MSHLESLSDQTITFETAYRTKRGRATLPVLPVKPGQVYITQGQWLNPFLLPCVEEFQSLCGKISEAHESHVAKSNLKIYEDPWDNYLYHDS